MMTSMSIHIDAFNHQKDMEFVCESYSSEGERAQAPLRAS
jgi:hypothetical protein